MGHDNRYLVRRRQTWFVVVEVPPSLQAKLGRRLKRTLRTHDLHVARAGRWRVLAELKDRIEAARRGPQGDPVALEAAELREALAEAERQAEATPFLGDPDDVEAQAQAALSAPDTLLRDYIADRAEAIEGKHGYDVAKGFADVATGATTPLGHYVETWLTEGGSKGGPLKERTKHERRRAVVKLGEWLERQRLPAAVEGVTRRVAGRYVSECLLASGRDAVTLGKSVRSLGAYWQWLLRRGHIAEDTRNPWAGQAPTKPAGTTEEERAFTDAEVARLLGGGPDPTLADFMVVGALTGMRREEIGRLTVADCAGGVFVVRGGKTAAARRRVPVHSELSALVARRSTGKPASAFLFDELASKNPERTDPIGKKFTRHRRGFGIQDGEGRRSLVNFHSFRRWFITAAVNADQPPHMVSLVVGHTEGRKGMTLGRYWQGGDDNALRAVVEAVKLPPLPAPGEGKETERPLVAPDTAP